MTATLALLALAPSAFFDRPILLGAHRGGYAATPENTVAAFTETARRFPNALLETDANLTADGHVVLLHDPTVDRTTNGRGEITRLTLEEAKKLDAGYRWTQDGTTFPFRGKGVTIPTLEEALKAAPESRFLIDIKGGATNARAVVAAVRRAGAERRVLLASFQPAAMAEVRRLAPQVEHAYDFTTGARLLSALRGSPAQWESYRPAAPLVTMMKEQVERFRLTREEVQRVRAKGIRFQIHTLSTRAEIEKWLDFGVDSILSGDPALLDEVLRSRR